MNTNTSAAPVTRLYDPRQGQPPITSSLPKFARSFPEELRAKQKSESPHEGASPWARTPPASASAALLGICAEIFTPDEKKRMQKIEDNCAALDAESAAHCDPSVFDNEIWELLHDTTDNITTEERVTKCKALEVAKSDIPTWLKQIDDKYQRTVRGLLPFANRLLKALAARIESELRDIEKNGVGGRNDFWQIGGGDTNHFIYPLCRLADYTAHEIGLTENYNPQSGWLLRARLIDCGAIEQKAKLNRG